MSSPASPGLRSKSLGALHPPEDLAAARRPLSLLLNFFGIYYRHRAAAIYSGSLIEIFEGLGVSEPTLRTALSRMVSRELLEKQREGRRTFYAPTERAARILEDGHRRLWKTPAVAPSWDGSWTLVAFSLPDSRRDERHRLRQELIWAGFGPLQHGLWVHPGDQDVAGIVETMSLHDHVHVLVAREQSPSDAHRMVRNAFNLPEIAQRYVDFLGLWSQVEVSGESQADLVHQVLLHTDWLTLTRYDPGLPAVLVPEDWPVAEAEHRFRDLATRLAGPAGRAVGSTAVEIEVRPAPTA